MLAEIIALFFKHYTQLPPGVGFTLFGPAHLAWLAVLAAGCAAVALLYRAAPVRRRFLWQKTIAWAILGLEVLKDLLVWRVGAFHFGYLPLHLCGISMFINLWHAYRPNKTTAALLYSLSLPGAVAALLFPDWTFYPPVNIFAIQCFLVHGLLIAFPVMQMAAGEIRPDWRQLWRPVLFLLIGFFPVRLLNGLWHTNFWFISDASPGSPLTFLVEKMGNPGYLAGFFLLLLAVWAVMYLPFIAADIIRCRRRKQGPRKGNAA